jgi:hypothetical protein
MTKPPVRKFEEKDAYGRALARTLYIVDGVDAPAPVPNAKWVQVMDFDEDQERAANWPIATILQSARTKGFKIVTAQRFSSST